MASRELPSTTQGILDKCPRFRILLVGKSGAGKSSLINHTFNVELATVSHGAHGVCDINDEIMSPENPRFVLHDSQGFEPGEVGNLARVKNFILSRGEAVDVKDRVHAVWLCVDTPFAGGRVFETGDEEFLRLGLKVPIVIVFTKFDKLVSRHMFQIMKGEGQKVERKDIEKLATKQAEDAFEELCAAHVKRLGQNLSYTKVSVKPRYRHTLSNLVEITQGLLSAQDEGDVWIVSAMAQRASAQAKIDSSIEVGMKRYWQGIASSAHFKGVSLDSCLRTIHSEITSGWNFNDPEHLLDSEEFRKKILTFAQFVAPEPSEVSSWFSQSVDSINNMIGITSVVAGPVAPVAAVIGLSAMFIKWITKVYQRTPDVLRCLMGHIVDLTLVMDLLFLHILPLKPPRQLTWERIEFALEDYTQTTLPEVHREIRQYADSSSFAQTLVANNAHEKIVALIRKYRSEDFSSDS